MCRQTSWSEWNRISPILQMGKLRPMRKSKSGVSSHSRCLKVCNKKGGKWCRHLSVWSIHQSKCRCPISECIGRSTWLYKKKMHSDSTIDHISRLLPKEASKKAMKSVGGRHLRTSFLCSWPRRFFDQIYLFFLVTISERTNMLHEYLAI